MRYRYPAFFYLPDEGVVSAEFADFGHTPFGKRSLDPCSVTNMVSLVSIEKSDLDHRNIRPDEAAVQV
ncbi:MAG: hypothetical protein LBQ30_05915 [Treponema sp.]|nr:hypothetical protein [Treponema sp.]